MQAALRRHAVGSSSFIDDGAGGRIKSEPLVGGASSSQANIEEKFNDGAAGVGQRMMAPTITNNAASGRRRNKVLFHFVLDKIENSEQWPRCQLRDALFQRRGFMDSLERMVISFTHCPVHTDPSNPYAGQPSSSTNSRILNIFLRFKVPTYYETYT